VYSYTALAWLGIVLAVGYVQWRGYRSGYPSTQMLDASLWALVGGLVGARLAYVWPNWADYAGRPLALLSFWGGGLVFQGGLIGGAVALWLYALYAQLSFLRLVDMAAPAVALAQSLGWAGALMHGANYGLVLRSAVSIWLPDLYGVYGPRFPTQLLASLLAFALGFVLYLWSWRGWRPGVLGLLYLLGNGATQFLLEFTRADEAPHLGLLRVTQVAALGEALLAGALLLYFWPRRKVSNESIQPQ
jgi:phosphatidylglycerol:prolipoprotein diacylglycerol transferase